MPKSLSWGKYKKVYRKEWESMPDLKQWIAAVPGDELKAKCKFCIVEIRAHLNDLKNHAATAKHRARCAPNTVDVRKFAVHMGSSAAAGLVRDDQKRRELRIATYAACHTSINAVEELSDILKEEFGGSFQMHRTKCTAIIMSVLAPHFKAELLADLGDSPYSLYLDETTDISVTKLLCVCVKYRSKKHNRFVSTYMGLIEISQANATAITEAVVAFLSEHGLQINKLVGIATDGASVMVGKHHSVYTLLKQRQPTLQLVRCVCHSLDIVAHKAMQLLPSNIEFMLRETFNWFSHSAKRQDDYRRVYQTLNEGSCPLKVISPSCTRWLVMADCVNRILDQYDALKLHFNLASNAEHCYAARILSDMYNDETNTIYMTFLSPILSEIKAVNKVFQLETGDSLAVFRDLERLYLSTVKRIVKPSVLRMNSDDQLRFLDLKSSSIYLSLHDSDMGNTFQQQLGNSKLSQPSKDTVATRCFDFLKELVVQYQLRLPESIDMLRKMEMLNPSTVMSITARPKTTALPIDYFSCSIESLESQWRNVPSVGFSSKQTIDEFWLEVEAFKDAGGNNCFEELALGAIRMLTLPISNAHVERSFSQVALLKNDTRNRMGLKLLSSLMTIRSGLSRNGWTSASFKPPQGLLKRFDSSMY